MISSRARRAARRLRGRGGVRVTRTTPVSSVFGLDRGTAVDRHYIEGFLDAHGDRIRGTVLEVGDDTYTRRFGVGVERSEVLHRTGEGAGAGATIVGDFETGDGIPERAFDCVIFTQTLSFIRDARAALATLARSMTPDGTVLCTVAGISQISRYDMERWGDYWRFTDASVRLLFEEHFEDVAVETHGNVASACALLYGLAAEELPAETLAAHDPDYQVVITVLASRPR